MVVTYYSKFFRTGADRHNGILMHLPLLVAEKSTPSFGKPIIFTSLEVYKSIKSSENQLKVYLPKFGKFLEKNIWSVMVKVVVQVLITQCCLSVEVLQILLLIKRVFHILPLLIQVYYTLYILYLATWRSAVCCSEKQNLATHLLSF